MFSERLKQLRKEAKLTQKEIAEQFNISQQAYQVWESGKRNPKKETIQMFADFFNVSYLYLSGETDIKNSNKLSDADIKNILETGVASYDGKPISENDKEQIKILLDNYFKNH